MTCDGCARAVSNAITAQAPAAKVSVDLVYGQVTVEGDITDDALGRALGEAGFGFVGPAGG